MMAFIRLDDQKYLKPTNYKTENYQLFEKINQFQLKVVICLKITTDNSSTETQSGFHFAFWYKTFQTNRLQDRQLLK